MVVRVRDMRLAVRLGGAFALVCSMFAASLGMALWAIDRQSDAASRSTELQDVARLVDHVQFLDSDITGWQLGYLYEAAETNVTQAISPDGVARRGFLADKVDVYRTLDELDGRSLTAAEHASVAEMRPDWDAFFVLDDALLGMLRAGGPDVHQRVQKRNLDEGLPIFERVLAATQKLQDSVAARVKAANEETASIATLARVATIVAAVVALVLAVGLGYAVTRSVVRPVRRLAGALDRIAEGDLTARDRVPGHLDS
jgi:methyl-accepting chemotaxis protein